MHYQLRMTQLDKPDPADMGAETLTHADNKTTPGTELAPQHLPRNTTQQDTTPVRLHPADKI
jgi:hypothetical protein